MDKSYSRRLQLNSAIVKNPYWVFPVEDKGHENYQPVGRGLRTSLFCGKHVGFDVCRSISKHEGVVINGKDYTKKLAVRHRHMWCHKSSCPVCFIRGWSVRGARGVEGRLNEGVKRGLGKVEHILVSVPVADHDLSESVMRKKCRNVLIERGVIGAGMIFHGYRRDKARRVLVWSPHYHVLGFILGDYARCRDCKDKWNCRADCSGFDARAWQGFQTDGYFVKVFAERETVFGTSFYQLNHATIRIGIKRFHAVTYFGVCGNRKYKSEKSMSKSVCPACGDEMVRSAYVGKRHIVRDVAHADYVSCFPFDEFDEDGSPNFIAHNSRGV